MKLMWPRECNCRVSAQQRQGYKPDGACWRKWGVVSSAVCKKGRGQGGGRRVSCILRTTFFNMFNDVPSSSNI
eukprot:804447-Rhodomonas_salina.2